MRKRRLRTADRIVLLGAVRVAIVAVALIIPALVAPGAGAGVPAPTLPSADSFYAYSGRVPLAQLAPGTVLKSRLVQMTFEGKHVPFTGDQVLYRTSGEMGQPTVTVTTIFRPKVSNVLPRILSYQMAYDALGSECDPSYTLTGGNPSYSDNQYEAAVILGYVARGLTVTVPDYEGTALDWGAGQESGFGTLDAIRATEHVMGVPASTPVGMIGYSGGSIATEWASELAPTYASNLHIVAAAEGGIPVDFAHNLAYISGSPSWSGVIPAILVSLSHAFGIDLSTYLSAYGQKVAKQVAGGCIGNFTGSYPGLTVQQLLKPQYQNILAVPVFATAMNDLLMGSAPGHPESPLLMAVGNQDGTGDGVMVAADMEALAHEYCTQDVPVVFTEYKGLNHGDAAIPFEITAYPFLEARFDGLPPVNGCALIGKGDALAPLSTPTP